MLWAAKCLNCHLTCTLFIKRMVTCLRCLSCHPKQVSSRTCSLVRCPSEKSKTLTRSRFSTCHRLQITSATKYLGQKSSLSRHWTIWLRKGQNRVAKEVLILKKWDLKIQRTRKMESYNLKQCWREVHRLQTWTNPTLASIHPSLIITSPWWLTTSGRP